MSLEEELLTDLKPPVSLLLPILPLSQCGYVEGEGLAAELGVVAALAVTAEGLVDSDGEL